MREKCPIGVLVSGNGSNLQAILDACEDPNYPVQVKVVISNNPDAFALERAFKKSIPTAVIRHENFDSREAFDQEIIKTLTQHAVQLVVLAGFMRLLSSAFIRHFSQKILNIHPALLPSFPGTHAIQQAWDYGVKVTGVTVHFVDEGTDTGPIVLQEIVAREVNDSLESLEKKIHEVEHKLYPKAVRLFAEGKLSLKGRQVIVKH